MEGLTMHLVLQKRKLLNAVLMDFWSLESSGAVVNTFNTDY